MQAHNFNFSINFSYKMQRISRLRIVPRIRFQSTDRITPIVDSIAQLNLLETAALVSALKIKLNIADVVMAAPVAASGPAAAAPVEEVKEQTAFKVTLAKFDAATKAKIIKEIKALLPGANLVEVYLLAMGLWKMKCGGDLRRILNVTVNANSFLTISIG